MDRSAGDSVASQASEGLQAANVVAGEEVDLAVRLAEMVDDERLLRNELRSLKADLVGVRAEIARERLARMLRSEVNDLAAATSGEASRSGVASVVVERAERIFGARWAVVGYETDEQTVRFVHSASMPDDMKRDWAETSLASELPICDILRGDLERVALRDRSDFTPWPLLANESERADMQGLVFEPLGTVGRPAAALAIAWSEPHELDALERELLDLLVSRLEPAFARSERGEVNAEIASTLQTWLLDVGATDFDGLDVERLYEPGRDLLSVGGDWHDIVPLSGSRYAIVIGDVCGHDARAAVEMSQVRHVLATNLHVLDDPVAALQMTDGYLRRHKPHPLATALVVVVEPDGSATLTSAGHPPPIACEPGGAARIVECGLGPPLGSGLGSYSSRTATLGAGTVLSCFTDGVVEVRGEGIDESLESLRRDIEVVLRSAHDDSVSPLAAVLHMMQQRVDTPWRTDDAAALIVSVRSD